jgi:hypothetical protein
MRRYIREDEAASESVPAAAEPAPEAPELERAS